MKGAANMDEVIYAYSRAQAIEDGELVDVTSTAEEDGFVFPVALTSAAWVRYVQVPPKVTTQDELGRLRSVLQQLRLAMNSGKWGSEIHFCVFVHMEDYFSLLVELKAHCGPGDDGEPVVTVMLPGED